MFGHWTRATGRTDRELSHWATTTDSIFEYCKYCMEEWKQLGYFISLSGLSSILKTHTTSNRIILKSRSGNIERYIIWNVLHLRYTEGMQWLGIPNYDQGFPTMTGVSQLPESHLLGRPEAKACLTQNDSNHSGGMCVIVPACKNYVEIMYRYRKRVANTLYISVTNKRQLSIFIYHIRSKETWNEIKMEFRGNKSGESNKIVLVEGEPANQYSQASPIAG